MAELRMIFLYVGQGDGTFIIFPDNTTALIDLGSLKNSETAGRNSVETIASELKKLGKTTIDHLFITHSDRDHNNLLWELDLKISGISYTYPFNNVYIGGKKSDYSDLYVTLLLNQKNLQGRLTYWNENEHSLPNVCKWQWGGVKVFLLSVNVPTPRSLPNPKCIVLKLEFATWKIILSGDAEETAEDQMLKISYKNALSFLEAFCLKLGHHGAETATTDGWLKAVLPKCTVVSSDQKWGHPYCSVLERIEKETKIWKKSDLKHGYVCGIYNDTKKRKAGNDTRYIWTNHDNTQLIFSTLVYADNAQKDSIGGHYELLIRDNDNKIMFKIWNGLDKKPKESGWFNSEGI